MGFSLCSLWYSILYRLFLFLVFRIKALLIKIGGGFSYIKKNYRETIMNPNFKWDHLRIFYYVAQHRGMTKAERALNLEQGSISRRIKELEKQIGEQIFFRRRHGVELTDFGEFLFYHVKKMFNEVEKIKAYKKDIKLDPDFSVEENKKTIEIFKRVEYDIKTLKDKLLLKC